MAGLLVLGEVTFHDFELPEHFTIGGKQQLIIHTLPGGGRVVDAMGADEAPVRWAGVFSGQQAAERVRILERLRRAGRPASACVGCLALHSHRSGIRSAGFE